MALSGIEDRTLDRYNHSKLNIVIAHALLTQGKLQEATTLIADMARSVILEGHQNSYSTEFLLHQLSLPIKFPPTRSDSAPIEVESPPA